jgi:Rps23 Pro-64 3,4-dihydroxylase Tpa1-like proline 4-hydroxylase
MISGMRATDPAFLAKCLELVDFRLKTAALDRQLAMIRAQLLRGLGDLDGALDAYAALAGDPAADRNLAILSGASLPLDDGLGPVPFVRRENFLDARQQQDLWDAVAAADFRDASTSHSDGVRVDFGFRIAKEMRGIRPIRSWFLPLLKRAVGPPLLASLGIAAFEPGDWEMSVTRHDDGGVLRIHRDRGAINHLRALSYVFYFHREPRRYSGGDLLLFDETDRNAPRDLTAFTRLAPLNNSLVFFSPDRLHCVTQIRADPDPRNARWTINGWLRKES